MALAVHKKLIKYKIWVLAPKIVAHQSTLSELKCSRLYLILAPSEKLQSSILVNVQEFL